MSAANLERDTVTLTVRSSDFGRVLYLPGESIDKPLSIVRIGYSDTIGTAVQKWDPIGISPHWDYRGTGFGHAFYGPTSDCKTVGSITRCIPITWAPSLINPGQFATGASWSPSPWTRAQMGAWIGSLPPDQQDGTGQFYRRNRYYDPVSARFTQEDPIGLAGGLNVYGFAQGDPVNYSDPFGLCPPPSSCLALAATAAAADGPFPVGDVVAVGLAGTALWLAVKDALGDKALPRAGDREFRRQQEPMTVRLQAQGGGVEESIVIQSGQSGQITAADALFGLST